MIIRSNSTFSLMQTITDQLLLVINGDATGRPLRIWHISQKNEAIKEFERITK